MSNIFQRSELAESMANQLLSPSVLDEGLRSGLFLSSPRRTGKTTFLRNDLVPALEDRGALVIYVDLWSNTLAKPATLLHNAIQKNLKDLQTPGSSVLETFRRVSNVEIGAAGFKFGFKLDSIGSAHGPTLAQALTEVVDQAKTDLVLIIDEVQHAISSDDGNQLLLALKAARDAINPRPHTPGYFLFIGTGSHRAQVSELTAKRNHAFSGATSAAYPLLKGDYVEFLLNRLALTVKREKLPSLEVAIDAFDTLGNRPEEMLKALRQLLQQEGEPDVFLPVIASTLRSAAASIELEKVEQLGSLAQAIFNKIASTEGDARGIFSTDAAAEYSKSVGREVRVEEIQPVVIALVAENIIMRRGHGIYAITDQFVQEIWLEERALIEGS
ncbi:MULTISPECIES: ATP-binding protein [unclassified Pseudomonas]|uniref:ATP-binding protein n=1 Tax=unclassified Pseudomonas TaxID=196821 RepID=UPI00215C6EAB|nr:MULTISPECIES: ATP-binding protein [unclassified Pseudomonas]MCR8933629.1 ATP-binding protein [Pseudomonas sp. S11A4]MCR8977233.1 ATP-binding protein [Pseudomonas sp. S11P7]